MEDTETGFSVVLFDWQGTLFHDERDEVLSRIRASVTSIGQALDDADVMRLATSLAMRPSIRRCLPRMGEPTAPLSCIKRQRCSRVG